MATAAEHFGRAVDWLTCVEVNPGKMSAADRIAAAQMAQAQLACARFVFEHSMGTRYERFNSELRTGTRDLGTTSGSQSSDQE